MQKEVQGPRRAWSLYIWIKTWIAWLAIWNVFISFSKRGQELYEMLISGMSESSNHVGKGCGWSQLSCSVPLGCVFFFFFCAKIRQGTYAYQWLANCSVSWGSALRIAPVGCVVNYWVLWKFVVLLPGSREDGVGYHWGQICVWSSCQCPFSRPGVS